MPPTTNHDERDDEPVNAVELLRAIQGRLTSRRRVLAGSGLVLGSGALGLFSGDAFARDDEMGPRDRFNGGNSDVPGTDVDVLNYALTLEHLEDAFYRENTPSRKTLTESGTLAPFAPAVRESAFETVRLVGDHESTHVDVLEQVIRTLGGDPVPELEYEFGVRDDGEVDPDRFLMVAQALENTGVMAYTGAIGLIESPDFATAAATIATVEARHASYLNLLNGDTPFPAAFDDAQSMEAILDVASQFIVEESG